MRLMTTPKNDVQQAAPILSLHAAALILCTGLFFKLCLTFLHKGWPIWGTLQFGLRKPWYLGQIVKPELYRS